jgi:predicted DNA-binding WGR domain protein
MSDSARTFTYVGGRSNKWWRIYTPKVHEDQQWPKDWAVKVEYGRTGTEGQSHVKVFYAQSAARHYYESKISEKMSKGYKEKTVIIGTAPSSTMTLPKAVKTNFDIATFLNKARASIDKFRINHPEVDACWNQAEPIMAALAQKCPPPTDMHPYDYIETLYNWHYNGPKVWPGDWKKGKNGGMAMVLPKKAPCQHTTITKMGNNSYKCTACGNVVELDMPKDQVATEQRARRFFDLGA